MVIPAVTHYTQLAGALAQLNEVADVLRINRLCMNLGYLKNQLTQRFGPNWRDQWVIANVPVVWEVRRRLVSE